MRRVLPVTLLGFLLVALMVVIPAPGRAAAAVPVPNVPQPVNVLPSTLSSGFMGAYEYAYMLAQYAMSNNLLKGAAKAGTGVVPTLTEAQALAAAASKFKIPATAIAGGLTKVLGPVGLVISSAQLGLFLGNGASRIAGFNDDMVCSQDDETGVLRSVAAVTNGVDCEAYDMTVEAQQKANDDAVAGLMIPTLCDPVRCLQFQSLKSVNASYSWWCFTTTGAGLGQYEGVNARKGSTSQNLPWSNGRTCDNGEYALGAVLNEWFPPDSITIATAAGDATGNPQTVTPVVSTGDPERHLICTLRYSGGQTVSESSAPFFESDGAYAPAVCPDLPEGGVFEGWDIDLETDGLTSQNLLTNDALPSYTDFTENYAECMQGVCQLDLLKDSVSCFSAPEGCADWLTDANKATTYSCRYGSHAVALSECNVYGPSFKPNATTTGQTYGDPTTGQSPSQPTSTPKDASAFGSTVLDPSAQRQCFPTGWGVLNPVEWVTKPVQCALEWAFVPRPNVVKDETTKLNDKVNASVIGNAATITNAATAAFDVASGSCMGPAWHMQISFPWAGGGGMDETYYPLQSCSAPMSNFAFFFNVLTQGFVAIGACFAGLRYFSSALGFIGAGSRPVTESSVKFK